VISRVGTTPVDYEDSYVYEVGLFSHQALAGGARGELSGYGSIFDMQDLDSLSLPP